MGGRPVTLPEIPQGKALEEFIAAFYQVSGRYIERNVVQREKEEVLELDILTTDYDVAPPGTPNIVLTEVKSGNWGFPDLFKIRGWLDYIHIPSAVFVATKNKGHPEFFREKARGLGIELIIVHELRDAAGPLAVVTGTPAPDALDVAMWRFSYWIERCISSDLTHKRKCSTTERRYVELADYLHATNSGAFFRQTISERMQMLCGAYKKYPSISAHVGEELSGGVFDADVTKVSEALFRQTFYECEYNDIQISTMVEHRARLALMKYATDFVLYSRAGRPDLAKDSRRVKILGHEIELSSFESLPMTFRNGIARIQEEPFFYKYPVFWQWFMWLYGGFILVEKENDEYAHIASRTGIPVKEVPRALQAYDALFPTPGGWFTCTSPNAHIRKLKMFPIPFMGLGAHYRKLIYCQDKELSALPVTGLYTVTDLAHWSDAAVVLLRKWT